jgi:hypothetical protein
LYHEFRQHPQRLFFLSPSSGPQVSPKSDKRRDYIIALRKQNLSIYDIAQALEADGEALSPAMIAIILK